MIMESESSSDTESSDTTSQSGRSTRFLALLVLGFSIFLAGCTLSILAPFYTKEAEDHGMSVTSSGLVFASAFLLQIVSTPIFGKYLHRIGSVRLFVFGCVSSGITNIIFGFLPAIKSGQLFLGMSLLVRSLTAVGESAMSSAVYPLAMRCDRSSKSTVLAVMETMFGAGTTIGPFLGGLLFNCGGFLLPFLICGGLLILSGLAAFLVLPQADHDDQADLSPENVGGVAVNDEETEMVSYTSLLRSPLMVVAASITFLTGVSTQWYQPSLEPYVRNQFGLSSFQASLLFIIDGGVYSLLAPITGRLLDRGLDCLPVLGLGSLLISLGFLLLASFTPLTATPSLEQVAVGAGVHGLGMALNFIASITLMTQLAGKISAQDSEQIHGLATGIWISCESLGGVLGSTAGGASYDWLGWRYSCLIVASLQGAAVLLVFILCMVKMVRRGVKKEKKRLERNKLLADKKQSYGTINNNICV